MCVAFLVVLALWITIIPLLVVKYQIDTTNILLLTISLLLLIYFFY